MLTKTLKYSTLLISALLLGACAKEEVIKPNALAAFQQTTSVQKYWSNSIEVGKSAYLKLSPAIANNTIFINGASSGSIKAVDISSGKTLWQTRVNARLSSGLAANDSMLFVGTEDGRILALQQNGGKFVWEAKVVSDVLAAPAATNDVVIVKTESGHVSALDAQTGKALWNYSHQEPSLILRGSSSPKILDNNLVLCGFASGEMVAFNLRSGNVVWQQQVATPTSSFLAERMIDIDADPVIDNNVVYAVAYQGSIAALNAKTGHVLWQKPMSSNSGIAVDNKNVYITDAKGNAVALAKSNGEEVWKNDAFLNRGLSGPAVLGNAVVFGDAEGYVHWLDKTTGQNAAREKVSGGVAVPPILYNNALFVFSTDGYLIKVGNN
jgi:outer membrane protein assembly factor BamB